MFSFFSWFIEISSRDFDSSKYIAENEENGNWVEPVKSQQFHHMIQSSILSHAFLQIPFPVFSTPGKV